MTHPHARLKPAAAFAGALVATVTGSVFADEPPADQLARDLRAKAAELQQLRVQRRAEAEQHDRDAASVRTQIGRLATEAEAVRGEVAAAEQRVEQQDRDLARHRAEADAAEAGIRAVAGSVATLARSLGGRAASGVPSVQPTAGRWAAQADRLGGERVADLADLADAIAATHEMVGRHLAGHRARSIENRVVDLAGAGVADHAYVLRLGSIAEVFITEDGRVSGVAAREAGRAWQTPLREPVHERVEQAVSVARQQSPPRLVDVPLVVPRAAGDGE